MASKWFLNSILSSEIELNSFSGSIMDKFIIKPIISAEGLDKYWFVSSFLSILNYGTIGKFYKIS